MSIESFQNINVEFQVNETNREFLSLSSGNKRVDFFPEKMKNQDAYFVFTSPLYCSKPFKYVLHLSVEILKLKNFQIGQFFFFFFFFFFFLQIFFNLDFFFLGLLSNESSKENSNEAVFFKNEFFKLRKKKDNNILIMLDFEEKTAAILLKGVNLNSTKIDLNFNLDNGIKFCFKIGNDEMIKIHTLSISHMSGKDIHEFISEICFKKGSSCSPTQIHDKINLSAFLP